MRILPDLSPTQIGMLFSISGIIVFAMIIPAGFVMDPREKVVHGAEHRDSGAGLSSDPADE
jgi:hypothetical protein